MGFLTVASPLTGPAWGQFGGASDIGRLDAELAWQAGGPVAGTTGMLGVILDVETRWHLQAGAGSGDEQPPYIATTIELDLPDGWTAGALIWPESHRFDFGRGKFKQTLYGYEERFLVAVPIEIPADATGRIEVKATIGYQACDDQVCEMSTSLETSTAFEVVTANAGARLVRADVVELFAATLARTRSGVVASKPGPGIEIKKAKWWIAGAFGWAAMLWMLGRTLAISARPVPRVVVAVIAIATMYGTFSFVRDVTKTSELWIPYTEAAFDEAVGDQTVFIKFTADWCANCQVNERIILRNPEAVAELSRPDVTVFKVDLTGAHPEGEAHKDRLGGGGIPLIAVYTPGVEQPLTLRGQLATAQPVIDALQGKHAAADADRQVFDFLNWQFSVAKNATLLILGIAILAGFFMNFTPCVLPVVPLKILSLQAHAKNPAKCFRLGLIFAAGIVSFYAVLGVVMALVAGVDWGEPFRFWWVTLPLGLVVGGMGFGMLGLFTIRLPQFLYMFNPQSDTASGSFFMGVFTAILSTPCTGPLLGATIVWVALQPPAVSFLTLLMMGVGMAFPYVLLTANPKWLDRLPRPGPGSELIKQVMGLLLFAAAVWFMGSAAVSFGA